MLGPERKVKSAPEFPAIPSPLPSVRSPDAVGERDAEPRRRLSVAQQSQADPPSAQPTGPDGPSDETGAAKQALAANLEGMIEGMLQSTRFATAAATKTRSWARQIGEAAALDASSDGTAFTASSLIADLAEARPVAPEEKTRAAAPRRWWIDAVLALACLVSVASAGYLTFAP